MILVKYINNSVSVLFMLLIVYGKLEKRSFIVALTHLISYSVLSLFISSNLLFVLNTPLALVSFYIFYDIKFKHLITVFGLSIIVSMIAEPLTIVVVLPIMTALGVELSTTFIEASVTLYLSITIPLYITTALISRYLKPHILIESIIQNIEDTAFFISTTTLLALMTMRLTQIGANFGIYFLSMGLLILSIILFTYISLIKVLDNKRVYVDQVFFAKIVDDINDIKRIQEKYKDKLDTLPKEIRINDALLTNNNLLSAFLLDNEKEFDFDIQDDLHISDQEVAKLIRLMKCIPQLKKGEKMTISKRGNNVSVKIDYNLGSKLGCIKNYLKLTILGYRVKSMKTIHVDLGSRRVTLNYYLITIFSFLLIGLLYLSFTPGFNSVAYKFMGQVYVISSILAFFLIALVVISYLNNYYELFKKNIDVYERMVRRSVDRVRMIQHDYNNLFETSHNSFINNFLSIDNTYLASLVYAKTVNASKNNISVTVNHPFDVSGLSKLNRIEIQRLFGNLLDNAIEHVSANGTVVLSSFKSDGLQGYSVENSGKSIASKDIEKLLKIGFSTKGESRGLGLHIINKIIRKHDGKLEVEITDKTTFKFSLPGI